MYDFLIVGAGLYGATFARLATDAGYSCLVIEKRKHVAGIANTEPHDDYFIHKHGAHIFHTDYHDVWSFVNRFTRFNRYTHQPVAYYFGKLYSLPLNMNTFCQLFGMVSTKTAEEKIKAEINAAGVTEITNAEEKVISMVGTTIYDKLVKSYVEKQWGRPCRELPPDVIEHMPLRFTFDNIYFDDRYQGIPVDGYTRMVERMLDGIEVMVNVDFFNTRDEAEKEAKYIIFTGSIDAFFDYRYGALEYRSLVFVEKSYRNDNVQGVAVMNYTDETLPYTRVIEHKHFTGSACHGTVLTFEYSRPSFPRDREPYYPVNNEDNTRLFNRYMHDASQLKNVHFGGRLGSFRYMDMDEAIRQATDDFQSIHARLRG